MNPDAAGRKTNVTALVAMGAAISGFTCFWGVGGLLAVLLGIAALREIDRAQGRESGRALGIAAIALGGANVAAMIVLLGVGIAFVARPSPPTPFAKPGASPMPILPPLPRSTASPRNAGKPPSADEEPWRRVQGVRETTVGRIRLVDLGAKTGSLTADLDVQRRAARDAGEKLLLLVVAPNCLPCNGVTLALPDARMQAALDRVRLVRVDAADHATELVHLGVPVESVPGFALLGDTLRPVDYVHGGEWDADVPENIAPVLRAFVRGSYQRRRHPFRGPERPDETAL